MWNGEVFGYNKNELFEFGISDGESDTIAVSRYLNIVCEGAVLSGDPEYVGNKIAMALSYIYGPYAFIYFHKASNSIHFGRDPFGRRRCL